MKAILQLFRNFILTTKRFPLPILSGILSFVFLIIEIHFRHIGENIVHDYRYVKLFLECMTGISLFIAMDIFVESQHTSQITRLGLYLLSFCILGLHYFSITPGMFDSETIFVSRYLIFFVCFHLLVSFVAFHHSKAIIPFWQFNYYLLKRFVTSLLYSITLFIGLTSAMWALDKLFNIHINPDFYTDLAAFILLIFNTIFFLKGIPTNYSVFEKAVDFNKSIRIFVQYVLLPIIVIYITILYLYMIKILVNQTLPNGWVCVPILIFSIVGIFAYLLTYPIRLQENNRLIYVYSKYFFYILLPLLSLYFIAIVKRIMPYGITEDRYLVFILGIWIITICIYILSSKVDNIIVIPVSLFLLLAISAVGPWGMFQLSVANQVMRLEHLLKRNHLLENGKLVALDKKYKVSKKDASSIRSIFSYLNKRGELNAVHPWLDEQDQSKLDSAILKNDLVYINSIFSDLGPEENAPYELHHYFVANENTLLNRLFSVNGYSTITQFACNIDDQNHNSNNDSSIVSATLIKDSLVFTQSDHIHFAVELNNKFKSLVKYSQQKDSLQRYEKSSSRTLKVINESSQTFNIPPDSMLIFQNNCKIAISLLEFIQQDTTLEIYRIEGFLLQ